MNPHPCHEESHESQAPEGDRRGRLQERVRRTAQETTRTEEVDRPTTRGSERGSLHYDTSMGKCRTLSGQRTTFFRRGSLGNKRPATFEGKIRKIFKKLAIWQVSLLTTCHLASILLSSHLRDARSRPSKSLFPSFLKCDNCGA